jgi:hypothetical protein
LRVLWISCVLTFWHYQPNLNAFISLLWQSYLLARTLIGFISQSDRFSSWKKGNILQFSLTMLGAQIFLCSGRTLRPSQNSLIFSPSWQF